MEFELFRVGSGSVSVSGLLDLLQFLLKVYCARGPFLISFVPTLTYSAVDWASASNTSRQNFIALFGAHYLYNAFTNGLMTQAMAY